MVLDFLAVENFDFTRKIAKKKLCEKLVKMLGFCQKFDFSNSVQNWIFFCIGITFKMVPLHPYMSDGFTAMI